MILITGGTGQSGVPIVKELSRRGAKFKVLVRNPAKAAAVSVPGAQLVSGDLADKASLAAACAGVTMLLLNSSPTPDIVSLQVGVIDAAKTAGVKRIVKFSAAGADPHATARFSRFHGQVEQILKQSGLAWTSLRPTFFMENLLSMAGMIKGGTIYQPTGDGKAPFVALEDVAAAIATTLLDSGHEGKTYEITGPADLSYHDIAAVLSKVLGKPIKYVDVLPEVVKKAMMDGGVPEWAADGINELSAAMKSGAMAGPSVDVEKLTGRKPMTLEAWITQNAAAFK